MLVITDGLVALCRQTACASSGSSVRLACTYFIPGFAPPFSLPFPPVVPPRNSAHQHAFLEKGANRRRRHRPLPPSVSRHRRLFLVHPHRHCTSHILWAMQSLTPSSAPYIFTSGGTARRLSSAGAYDSQAGLGYTAPRGYHHQPNGHTYGPGSGTEHTSYQTAPSVAQSPYSANHNSGIVPHPSPPPPSNSLSPSYTDQPWPSSTPSPPSLHHSPAGHSAYSSTAATSYDPLPGRNSTYTNYNNYDAPRTTLSPAYAPQAPSGNYDGTLCGLHRSPYTHDSGYHSPTHSDPLGYSAHPSYEAPAGRNAHAGPVRCEWDHCRLPLEDSSPAGIARHLKQYHDVAVTDNRTRKPCLWGGRRCNKDMYMSSFGKHIAECHLRNMVKQCPQCGADFARADTLSRHIKAFCPNSSG
ncbi:hypothetical protein C8Q79DRAFT_666195 [Trametes meyenii]|nr:hypothetical protein C8Q79DRAFT_666195 [Trametes meyenii]